MSNNVALAAAIAVGIQALLAFAGPPPSRTASMPIAKGGSPSRGLSVWCVSQFAIRLVWYLSAVARLSFLSDPTPPGGAGTDSAAVAVYAVSTRDLASVLLADLVATALTLIFVTAPEMCAAVSVATWATSILCIGAADMLSRRGPGVPGVIDARVAYIAVIAAHAAAAPVLAFYSS